MPLGYAKSRVCQAALANTSLTIETGRTSPVSAVSAALAPDASGTKTEGRTLLHLRLLSCRWAAFLLYQVLAGRGWGRGWASDSLHHGKEP